MRRRRSATLAAAAVAACAFAGVAARAPEPATPAPAPSPAAAAGALGQISGTVLTPARRPVRGASVALLPEGGGYVYGTSTDENGRYALTGLMPATYSVLVMDPGGNVLRKDRVNARPLFRNLVDFVSEPEGSPRAHIPVPPPPPGGAPATLDISGILLSESAEPIAEGWILAGQMGIETPSLRARTDAEGNVRLVGVPAGWYRITGRALGHVTWSLGPIILEGGRSVSVRLTLLPFPLGHPENPEDVIVPLDPVPPEAFEPQR